MDIQLKDLPSKEFIPGYHGKMIHAQNMTLAFWEVEKGAIVPIHNHVNEQIMQVLEGSFEFTLDGLTKIYQKGDLVLVPPHIPHGGKAITACRLMDVFSPVREEYR